ncbi:dihydroorotase [Dechloromonas sp. HYN0024]|nr:dihydroorotase [Dechloromonas sp. HYN0024]
MNMQITITRPDDWHLHLRDGEALSAVLAHTAAQFARAIVMPNLKPPVTTVGQAAAYRDRIVAALPDGASFAPLMTLYLTDNTPASEVAQAAASGFVKAIKLYPAGATTNSDAGLTDIAKAYDTLAEMERVGLPLLVHGEVTDPKIDLFDREKVFIDTVLLPLTSRFPRLKVVMEHITTKDAAEFVATSGPNVAATITAHHLLYNRNAIFQGGVRPHWYCLPVLKRETHREALVAAAVSANPKFFLGTDSAPHAKMTKEAACGCAGCYTAYAAIELYAEAFEQAGALDRLEAFASFHGPDWYGLPRNSGKITLAKQEWTVPADYPYISSDTIVPLRAGETLSWKVL